MLYDDDDDVELWWVNSLVQVSVIGGDWWNHLPLFHFDRFVHFVPFLRTIFAFSYSICLSLEKRLYFFHNWDDGVGSENEREGRTRERERERGRWLNWRLYTWRNMTPETKWRRHQEHCSRSLIIISYKREKRANLTDRLRVQPVKRSEVININNNKNRESTLIIIIIKTAPARVELRECMENIEKVGVRLVQQQPKFINFFCYF